MFWISYPRAPLWLHVTKTSCHSTVLTNSLCRWAGITIHGPKLLTKKERDQRPRILIALSNPQVEPLPGYTLYNSPNQPLKLCHIGRKAQQMANGALIAYVARSKGKGRVRKPTAVIFLICNTRQSVRDRSALPRSTTSDALSSVSFSLQLFLSLLCLSLSLSIFSPWEPTAEKISPVNLCFLDDCFAILSFLPRNFPKRRLFVLLGLLSSFSIYSSSSMVLIEKG